MEILCQKSCSNWYPQLHLGLIPSTLGHLKRSCPLQEIISVPHKFWHIHANMYHQWCMYGCPMGQHMSPVVYAYRELHWFNSFNINQLCPVEKNTNNRAIMSGHTKYRPDCRECVKKYRWGNQASWIFWPKCATVQLQKQIHTFTMY